MLPVVAGNDAVGNNGYVDKGLEVSKSKEDSRRGAIVHFNKFAIKNASLKFEEVQSEEDVNKLLGQFVDYLIKDAGIGSSHMSNVFGNVKGALEVRNKETLRDSNTVQ